MRKLSRKEMVAGAVLASVLLMAGALRYCPPKRGGQADRLLYEVATFNTPACEDDGDCANLTTCAPERVPRCSPYDETRKGFPRFCGCTPFRWIPSPDGGAERIFVKCVHNPDGGTPICGEWDDHQFVILSPDGGVVVDEHGAVL